MTCKYCEVPTIGNNVICDACLYELEDSDSGHEDYEHEEPDPEMLFCKCGAYRQTKEGKYIQVADCCC